MSRVKTQRVNPHVPSFKVWSILRGSCGVCGVDVEPQCREGETVGSGAGVGFESQLNTSSCDQADDFMSTPKSL